MFRFAIWYAPIWGQMTRYVEYVMASNTDHAVMKFYGTDAGDNCFEIIEIHRC